MNVASSKSEQPAVLGQPPEKSVVEALRTINDKVQKTFFNLIQRNRTYYYDTYFGTNNPLLLFFKNLLRPKRFLTKFVYGQVVPLPAAITMGDPLPPFTPSEQALSICEQFKRDGVVILPGAFREIADHVINKYNIRIERYKTSEDYEYYGGDRYLRQIDQKLLHFMVDELVLQVFGLYYQRQPYLRAPIDLSIAYPSYDMPSTRDADPKHLRLNMGWHYDTPNLVQVAVLLNDVTEKDSHMQVVKGEHRSHRVNLGKWDYYYSDEYIRDHCEIVRCCGPKGTIYFFDTNAMHRLFLVKNSPRMMIKTPYMPGNDILPLKHKDVDHTILVEGGVNLGSLAPIQRDALRYLPLLPC